MSHQPLKLPQASRSSKKQQIRQALDKQAQERKPVEFPLPEHVHSEAQDHEGRDDAMSQTIQLDMRRAMPAIELAVAPPVGAVAEVVPSIPQSMLSPAVAAPVQMDLRKASPSLELAITGPTEVTAEMMAVIAGRPGPPGPPGPAGPGTGGGTEKSLHVDASRPIAYAGYANRIVRLDYATWPPAETTASTTDVHADWPNRASLEYA